MHDHANQVVYMHCTYSLGWKERFHHWIRQRHKCWVELQGSPHPNCHAQVRESHGRMLSELKSEDMLMSNCCEKEHTVLSDCCFRLPRFLKASPLKMGDEILEINGVPIVEQDQTEVRSYCYTMFLLAQAGVGLWKYWPIEINTVTEYSLYITPIMTHCSTDGN